MHRHVLMSWHDPGEVELALLDDADPEPEGLEDPEGVEDPDD